MTIFPKALTGLLIAFSAMLPAAAHADLTAVYGVPGTDHRMTVAIAANGDIRAEIDDPSMYWVVLQGVGYYIQLTPKATHVSALDDIAVVTREAMDKLDPGQQAQLAGHSSVHTLLAKGTMAVGGRTGDAYFMQAPDGTISPMPWVVISHDPALAPLGQAMAEQFAMSAKMDPYAMAGTGEDFARAEAVLRKGAPILFAGAQLLSVSEAKIDESRFALPAPRETRDQIRQWYSMQEH